MMTSAVSKALVSLLSEATKLVKEVRKIVEYEHNKVKKEDER